MALTLLIGKNVLSHNLKFIYNFPEQNTSNIKYIPQVRGRNENQEDMQLKHAMKI